MQGKVRGGPVWLYLSDELWNIFHLEIFLASCCTQIPSLTTSQGQRKSWRPQLSHDRLYSSSSDYKYWQLLLSSPECWNIARKAPTKGAFSVATPTVLCHEEPARRIQSPLLFFILFLYGIRDSWHGPIRGGLNRTQCSMLQSTVTGQYTMMIKNIKVTYGVSDDY